MEDCLTIPDDVFDFFAADPQGPHTTLRRVANDSQSRMHASLNNFLKEVPLETVNETRKDPQFSWFWKQAVDVDREARIWFAERLVSRSISHKRIQILREEFDVGRPRPYSISPLADLKVDEEHLVKLSEFEFDGSRLLRNGYAFTLLSTTEAPNSTYWLLNLLYENNLQEHASIRLDPLMFGPTHSFPSVFYRMLVYGRPLDWGRVSQLRQIDHGRWFPDSLSHRSKFTDYCWEPRENEVAFICEEVPVAQSVSTEGARYFHAIYSRVTQQIKHLDGALRLFTDAEIETRHAQHLRNSGKLGLREKVYRIDEPISADSFGALTQAFFIWNGDVQKYFSHVIARK